MIPKRIIQFWCSGSIRRPLPLSAKASAAALKSLNPDFEYLFFDDQAVEDFVRNEFPQYVSVFDGFPLKVQRFDFFRYLAVFRLGGFYLDLDVYPAQPFNALLENDCVFPFEELTVNQHLRTKHGMDWEIGNFAFAAANEHPFIHAIIENCIRAQKDPNFTSPLMCGIPKLFRRDFFVYNTTGPVMVSWTLASNPALAKHVHILFPHNVCDECTWHQFGDYGAHLMTGSWRSKGNFIKRRLANLWESRLRRKLMKQSRQLGATRAGQRSVVSSQRSEAVSMQNEKCRVKNGGQDSELSRTALR